MSHYSVLVLTDDDTTVEELLAPFNENIEVEPYVLHTKEELIAKEKQDITNVIYEPWHWRYVGVEHAKKMKATGQVLEEYLGVAENG